MRYQYAGETSLSRYSRTRTTTLLRARAPGCFASQPTRRRSALSKEKGLTLLSRSTCLVCPYLSTVIYKKTVSYEKHEGSVKGDTSLAPVTLILPTKKF